MALPSSGPISASDINSELGRTSTSQISLDDARSGVYSTINDASGDKPPSTGEVSYSDWYGYDHNPTSGSLILIGISNRATTTRGICILTINTPGYFDKPLSVGAIGYSDQFGTLPLSSGYYNTEQGVWIEIGISGLVVGVTACGSAI